MFKRLLILVLIISLLSLGGCKEKRMENIEKELVIYDEVNVEEDEDSFLCTPAGEGPFPGVLYNHGGKGDAIGGDLEGTCRALAEAGYVAYSQQRRLTLDMEGHLDDVLEGLDVLMSNNAVDEYNIAIMGFSRGGFLAFTAAIKNPGVFSSIILMAPAPVGTALIDSLGFVNKISAPVLILVSENDLYQADHVSLANDVKDALEAENKDVELILYPPYSDDGHELFFEVGDYWDDVLEFLDETI